MTPLPIHVVHAGASGATVTTTYQGEAYVRRLMYAYLAHHGVWAAFAMLERGVKIVSRPLVLV